VTAKEEGGKKVKILGGERRGVANEGKVHSHQYGRLPGL